MVKRALASMKINGGARYMPDGENGTSYTITSLEMSMSIYSYANVLDDDIDYESFPGIKDKSKSYFAGIIDGEYESGDNKGITKASVSFSIDTRVPSKNALAASSFILPCGDATCGEGEMKGTHKTCPPDNSEENYVGSSLIGALTFNNETVLDGTTMTASATKYCDVMEEDPTIPKTHRPVKTLELSLSADFIALGHQSDFSLQNVGATFRVYKVHVQKKVDMGFETVTDFEFTANAMLVFNTSNSTTLFGKATFGAVFSVRKKYSQDEEKYIQDLMLIDNTSEKDKMKTGRAHQEEIVANTDAKNFDLEVFGTVSLVYVQHMDDKNTTTVSTLGRSAYDEREAGMTASFGEAPSASRPGVSLVLTLDGYVNFKYGNAVCQDPRYLNVPYFNSSLTASLVIDRHGNLTNQSQGMLNISGMRIEVMGYCEGNEVTIPFDYAGTILSNAGNTFAKMDEALRGTITKYSDIDQQLEEFVFCEKRASFEVAVRMAALSPDLTMTDLSGKVDYFVDPNANGTTPEKFFRVALQGTVTYVMSQGESIAFKAIAIFDGYSNVFAFELGGTYKTKYDNGMALSLSLLGSFRLPCEEYGDLHAQTKFAISNTSIDWLQNVSAIGTFDANCDFSKWGVGASITVSPPPRIPIANGAFNILLPETFTVLVSKFTEEDEMTEKEVEVLSIQASATIGIATLDFKYVKRKNEKKPSLEFGIEFRSCTLREMLIEVDKVLPGVIPETLLGSATAKASLGIPEKDEIELKAFIMRLAREQLDNDDSGDDETLTAALGGFDLTSWLLDMKLPKVTVLASKLKTYSGSEVGGLRTHISVIVSELEIFKQPFELALLIDTKKRFMLYFGILVKKDGSGFDFGGGDDNATSVNATSGNSTTHSIAADPAAGLLSFFSTLLKIPFMLLAPAVTRIGIRWTSANMDIDWTDTKLSQSFPCRIDQAAKGLYIYTENDITSPPAVSLASLMKNSMELLAGDPSVPEHEKFFLQRIFASALEPDQAKRTEMGIPVSANEICIGLKFVDPKRVGYPMGPWNSPIRFLGFGMGMCIAYGAKGMTFTMYAESEVQVDVPYRVSTPISKKRVTIQSKSSFSVVLDPVLLSLNVLTSSSLIAESQIWFNPFGVVPNLGLIFPYTFGIGIAINLQSGVPVPSLIALEGGFAGCGYGFDEEASTVNYLNPTPYPEDPTKKNKTATLAGVPSLGEGVEGAMAGLDELFCNEKDPYGKGSDVSRRRMLSFAASSRIILAYFFSHTFRYSVSHRFSLRHNLTNPCCASW